LLSLLNNRHQKKTALLKSISLSSCIPKRIDDLEKQGLITTTTKRFEKNAKWIELTPLGEAVAQHLSMIYELCTAGVSLSSPESLGVPDGL
jgi:DNA-binding PadR family transcriptional regulator